MANCDKCGKPIKEGVKFCPSCGTAVDAVKSKKQPEGPAKCANCGKPLKEGAAFCASCGTAVSGAPKRPAGSVPQRPPASRGSRSGLRKNSELRALAREQIKGSRGKIILAVLIYGAVIGVSNVIPVIGSIILGGPMMLGLMGFLLNKARGYNADFADLFDTFKSKGGSNNQLIQSILLSLVQGIFIWLWSLLLIIPGIIKGISYSMSFYIMKDNPDIGAMDAITQSRQMMKGRKGKYFRLQLSFIGWFLLFCVPYLGAVVLLAAESEAFIIFIVLGFLTLVGGSIWILPYIAMSFANFYEDLRENS